MNVKRFQATDLTGVIQSAIFIAKPTIENIKSISRNVMDSHGGQIGLLTKLGEYGPLSHQLYEEFCDDGMIWDYEVSEEFGRHILSRLLAGEDLPTNAEAENMMRDIVHSA